jgi:prepilin-type N-terminal cleavage/methylation domain-containing protein
MRPRCAAFSLIELLVVIAIIALLIGLLLPAVQRAREAGYRAKCTNNLKQIGIAMQAYHDTNLILPSGFCTSGTFLHTGWELHLLPYLEQNGLWNQSVAYLEANPAGTDSTSYPAVSFTMPTFICPSNTYPTTANFGPTYALTSYLGCAGTSSNNPVSADGVLYAGSQVRLTDITDGSSNTLLVGERPVTVDLYWGWLWSPFGTGKGNGECVLGSQDVALAAIFGGPATNVGLKAPSARPIQSDGAHWWSFHPGGANFVCCDGSVHFLPYSANDVIVTLSTRAGSEVFTAPY